MLGCDLVCGSGRRGKIEDVERQRLIAIPAVAAYNILRNRVARLVLEVGILSEGLMSRFSTVGMKKS